MFYFIKKLQYQKKNKIVFLIKKRWELLNIMQSSLNVKYAAKAIIQKIYDERNIIFKINYWTLEGEKKHFWDLHYLNE